MATRKAQPAAGEVEVDGRRLRLTNLDKPMYQVAGFTKGEVVDYYARIADAVLPYVRGRPLTLKRFPDGVGGAYFFERNCPRYKPEWVRTTPVWSHTHERDYHHCVAADRPTLLWLANLAALELHPTLAPAADLDRPTWLVFDLDPGYPAGLLECCSLALALRGMLERVDLQAFVKGSGGKGLHVYVPLDGQVTYARTKAFARAVAETLASGFPDRALATSSRAERAGRVLIDWMQNQRGRTTVAPYSLRAVDPPRVSMPLEWREIEDALDRDDATPLVFEPDAALARAAQRGDVWAPLLELRQRLPEDVA